MLLILLVGYILTLKQPAQSEHPPTGIVIQSNSGFSFHGWIGNGTSEDPYIIEGLTMVTSGPSISISDADVYFIIRNCTLESTTGAPPRAIVLDTVKNGVIENCTLIANKAWAPYGADVVFSGVCVEVFESADCRIEHCRLYGGATGLMISSTNSCEVVNNTICDNWEAVDVEDSSGCSFSGNLVFDSNNGITLSRTNMCEIDTQRISCKYSGLQLHYSKNYRITNNRFLNCGIWLGWGYNPINSSHVFLNNSINAKPYGFFHNSSDTKVDAHGYGQVVLSYCTNVTITRGDFRNSSVGIEIKSSQQCVIERSNFLGNKRMGVSVEGGRDIIVTNCTFIENTWTTDVRSSSNITINGNTFSHNIFSIKIEESEKCTISGNTIMNSVNSIQVTNSELCEISDNYLENNTGGIYVRHSTFCTIFENHVYYCESTGIWLGADSESCQVFLNSIGGNRKNAQDDGDMNQWDDGVSIGNSWSDYSGAGWYDISGTASNYDRYPSVLSGEWGQHNLVMLVVAVGVIAFGILVIVFIFLKKRSQG